ncbi:uncharacterized protein [Solanum tuberosum]|uniref:uncharacterized protein n=1 Tax=Solanum tuberosum TaxID=4113 RepID=UPI00073A2E60|nr:PREDICTED: uncharacterized protein LOC107063128 [Solanum tuberosum]
MTGETTATLTTTQTITSNTSVIDHNHPYHLHASDAPGMTIVNNPFDGKGYQGWKRCVLIALSAKNKLGFITGAQPIPADDSPDLQAWNRCNDMVTSWILNSLSKEIVDNVIYSRTVRELWMSLEHRFGQSNGYFTKLKRLWDELDSLNTNVKCNCVCICEGKQKLQKSLEDERLMQFLMGLNDTYSQARGNILMINPLPDINLALFFVFLQDENQRESYVNSTVNPDSSAFMVGNSHQYRISKQGQRSIASSSKFGNVYPRPAPAGSQQTQLQGFLIQNQNPKFKGKKANYNPNVTCTYCGKTGHVELKCFRLIGFPDDFQFTHEKGFNNQVKGNGDQIRGN